MLIDRRTTDTVFAWITRGLIGVLVYLAVDMRADLKELSKQMPVVQEQIRLMQDDNSRIKNKIFIYRQPARKPDEMDFANLIKKFPL